MPYDSFKLCAECLDDRRLNKQIIEAKTIYNIIVENKIVGSWTNHPIVKMWRDYPEALALYYNECLYQWKEVRKKNHKYVKIEVDVKSGVVLPSWLGDERLHSSHRANLLRKDFDYYSQYKWIENEKEYWLMPYWWGDSGYGKIPEEKVRKSVKKDIVKDAEKKNIVGKKYVIRRK